MKLIKGDTVENQIKHIDTILDRFSRRLHKTTAGVISPCLISNYVKSPDDGVVLRTMFPVDGKVVLGAMYVEEMPKAGIDIYTTISHGVGTRKESVFTKRQSTLVKPNVNVSAGSRIALIVRPRNEMKVYGVWVSILWVPNIKGTVVKQYIIDELEKAGKEYALLEEEV